MKVLLLCPDLKGAGGVANYYRGLELQKESNIDSFYVNKVGASGIKSLIVMFFKWCNFFFKCSSYDIIHVNPSLDFKSFIRDAGFIFLAKIRNKKVVTFFRGWEDGFEDKIRRSSILKRILILSYDKTDLFIFLGKIFHDKYLSISNKTEVRHSFETTLADEKLLDGFNIETKLLPKNKISLVFISRIIEAKGVIRAIDTLKILRKTLGNKVELCIIGDGPDLKMSKNYVEEKGIDGVEFAGYLIGQEKVDAMQTKNIMIFPTLYGEGMPNSILEGMLMGMPIITSSVAAIPDVVTNQNGLVDPEVNPNRMALFIQDLVGNTEAFNRMVKNNHEKAKAFYVTEKVRTRILNYYSKL